MSLYLQFIVQIILRLSDLFSLKLKKKMGKIKDIVYTPNVKNVAIYDKIYAEYEILHDYFGKNANDVMKRLKKIKKETR